MEEGSVLIADDARVLFRGVRVGVGIDYGRVSRIFHERYQVDYVGTTANRAARLCQSTEAGQIVCSKKVVKKLEDEGFGFVNSLFTRIGIKTLKGVTTFEAFGVLPKALIGRVFETTGPQLEMKKIELWSESR
ncbi:hypothetical protein GEMRC1_005512 [Eukaryota sp. GEM-RC1]